MTRWGVLVLMLALSAVLPGAANAGTYRLVAPDGTVHYTNAPTDPQYRRMGLSTPDPGPSWPEFPVRDLTLYAREIREAAARYGIEEALIKAVIRVESGFNSRAVSPKGARGLMQLMPSTASMLGVRDSFDPRQNIDGGVRHLRSLIDRFGSDLRLALAAYNAGEQAVIAHGGIPPYRETQDYVTRILGLFRPNPPIVPSTPVPPVPPVPEPRSTYRTVDSDGTVTYTNIPPNGRL